MSAEQMRVAERIFVIEIIIIRIISTAIIIGNTIDTVCIVPTGLSWPCIILTNVIIITGQIRIARGAPKKQTRSTFGARLGHVDGTNLTTTVTTTRITTYKVRVVERLKYSTPTCNTHQKRSSGQKGKSSLRRALFIRRTQGDWNRSLVAVVGYYDCR